MKNLFILLFWLPSIVIAQDTIEGKVIEANSENKTIPVVGANIYWLNTTIGTFTDENGKFSIPYESTYKLLVISYVGFKTDTLSIDTPRYIKHALEPTDELNTIVVSSRKQATSKSYLKATNTFTVSSDELLKAACCNLSESFETNPSIDVNFADAVSGTKQIKMLGLTSPYILIATENIPSIRGASQAYGLSFIPGTWVESIQITKGAGSVVNGYESMAGQINAELQKPTKDHQLFINAYAANSERLELNTHFNTKVSDKWHTGLYVHGDLLDQKHDRNNDNFLDMPLFRQVNVMNRWQYTNSEKGIVSFINARYLYDEKQSGEVDFNPDTDRLSTNVPVLSGDEVWGSEINTERFEISGKLGYVNPEIPWQSLGVQVAYSHHNQDSYFGLREYDILQNSLYSNLIYNSIISDSRHKVKTGISFTYDSYDELVETTTFERIENSVGAFFEYNYDDLENLNLTAGIRADQHNRLGFFITPRLHLRYTPWEKSALRASIGRGIRSANIFAENQNLFATSRTIIIENTTGNIYGLDPEISWNFGISFLQGFNLLDRKGDISFDFYRTDFQNQVVIDWENPQEIRFYNLKGDSFANSFQVEVNYNIFKGADLRMAYKNYDVQTQYNSGKKIRPLTPEHRLFGNLEYKTTAKENGARWKFDVTYNWLSEQRYPDTNTSPIEFQRPEFSPTIGTLNAQITKVFSPKFEIYLGGENITNVRQADPIIGANDPFGANFDSTFVYGPIFGGMYYTGLRYKLN